MLEDALPFLMCPHCGAALAIADRAVRCANRHVFDIARQGYVNLLPGDGPASTGDDSAMVEARERFLDTGHYAPIVDQILEIATGSEIALKEGCVVDVGAGTGHYLAATLDRMPGRVGLALDVSKYATRRASRAHERICAIVTDVWRPLPVRTDAASMVINVFAPRNGAEFRRILRADGTLVVVVPTDRHLVELVDTLGLLKVDERKDGRVHDQLDPYFTRAKIATCEYSMTLDRADIAALVAMGPSAWHTDPAHIQETLQALPEPVPVTASATVTGYRPR